MTILDYARVVEQTMKEYGYAAELTVNDANSNVNNSGMDCSQIMRDTGWKPCVTAKEMVNRFYTELLEGAGEA